MHAIITLAILCVIASLVWYAVEIATFIPALFKTIIKILILLAVAVYLASMIGLT